MLAMMTFRATLLSFALLLAPATAQDTLADLQKQFAGEAQTLAGRSPTREQRDELLARHTDVLQKFVAERAKGDDRWNGRLMLADLLLQAGNRDRAGETIAAIDGAAAPGLVLLTAASMAQHLGKKDLRTRCLEAALGKPSPLADRLAMARLLMTVLHEIPRGEQVFTEALAKAEDDEQRALIRFHRADTMRDREDLPDNAGFEEFDKLAKDLPKTYWGGIARDRLSATDLRPGSKAIPFTAKVRGGGEFTLAQQMGKVVVLAFWSAADHDTPTLVALLREMARRHGDRLAVLGICLDRDPAGIARAVQDLGIDFTVVGEGLGIETDVALRWFVEGPVVHVVDAQGKIAGLGLHAGTADARNELQTTVAGAIKP